MDIVKVTTVLELFFAFNNTESKDSLKLEESDYNDKFFRWTKNTFKHDRDLTVIFNNSRIVIFNNSKVRDRLLANTDKIQSDDEKINFGCNFNIIKDLVSVIHSEEITEDEKIDFIKEGNRLSDVKKKKEEDGNLGVQNKK